MEKYLVFKNNYVGADSKTEYPHGVKFTIKDTKDGFYFFQKDKVEIKFKDKLYEIGDIINQ